jgi:SAM-dependent methyltransferase
MKDRPSGAYYGQKLAAGRLLRCYELAPPRVQQYLLAEINLLRQLTRSAGSVLELGCGYGRVLEYMHRRGLWRVGIDTAVDSLKLGVDYTSGFPNCSLVAADAADLPFADGVFDSVVCVQNGMSAFGVDRRRLVREATRVSTREGLAVFSSYSPDLWTERLEWFRIQAEHGLLGEIDEDQTGNGVIVCKDGFRAETISQNEFIEIGNDLGLRWKVDEYHGSLICEYRRK